MCRAQKVCLQTERLNTVEILIFFKMTHRLSVDPIIIPALVVETRKMTVKPNLEKNKVARLTLSGVMTVFYWPKGRLHNGTQQSSEINSHTHDQ